MRDHSPSRRSGRSAGGVKSRISLLAGLEFRYDCGSQLHRRARGNPPASAKVLLRADLLKLGRTRAVHSLPIRLLLSVKITEEGRKLLPIVQPDRPDADPFVR